MTKQKIVALLAAAASTSVLAACGDDTTSSATRSGDAPAAGASVDRAFVAAMIPHHESAIKMAEIAQERGESSFVKALAGQIVATQSEELGTLRAQDAELEAAGEKPGDLGIPAEMMGMDDDPEALRTADPFDEAFLNMMVPHHEGAVEMAKAELARGKDPELKQLAQEIIDAQQREITEMRKQLDEA